MLKEVYFLSNFFGGEVLQPILQLFSHIRTVSYLSRLNWYQVVNKVSIVSCFAFLFNCMPVGRISDSMMVPT